MNINVVDDRDAVDVIIYFLSPRRGREKEEDKKGIVRIMLDFDDLYQYKAHYCYGI